MARISFFAPALFVTLLTALPLAAEPALGAAEFDAYTQGKTLTYGSGGVAYGAEEYLPDRRVRWSFLDGDCRDGEWFPKGDQICFTYEDRDTPQCWSFFLTPEGLAARFENDPGAEALYEGDAAKEPLLCLGPEVGT